MCGILGIVVVEKGEEHASSRIIVANHVSPFDYFAIALTRYCILVSVFDSVAVLQDFLVTPCLPLAKRLGHPGYRSTNVWNPKSGTSTRSRRFDQERQSVLFRLVYCRSLPRASANGTTFRRESVIEAVDDVSRRYYDERYCRISEIQQLAVLARCSHTTIGNPGLEAKVCRCCVGKRVLHVYPSGCVQTPFVF